MFNIPEEHLPDFVKDDQRMNVLFAPLRNRTVNPKDWDSKISAWKMLIKLYCLHNEVYSFTLSSLSNVFIRNGRAPSCLTVVVEDLLKSGDLQIVEVFLKKSSSSWSGWATDVLIKRPVSWSFTKIKNTLFTNNNEGNYVHLEVVKTKSDNLLQSIPDKYKNKLITLADLLEITKKDASNIDSIKLLLHGLAVQSKIDVTKLNDNINDEAQSLLIKFGDGHKVKPISDVDVGVYTLEKNEKLLLKNMEQLEDEVLNCVKEAKMHLAKGHRQMAKNCLRKRHEIEKRINKKANALHNVQTLLEQIRDTHSDAHVWESYKQALSAFDSTFKQTGISEDAIEDTMIKLGEMLDLHEDIQTSLARPAAAVFGNDSDLEEELAELMKTDEKKSVNEDDSVEDIEKFLQDLNIMPRIPDVSPNQSQAEASMK